MSIIKRHILRYWMRYNQHYKRRLTFIFGVFALHQLYIRLTFNTLITNNIQYFDVNDSPDYVLTKNDAISEIRPLKTILNWNHYFDPGTFFSKTIDQQVLLESGCPVNECIFTDDLDLFNTSDIVVFFAQYLYDIPSYRFPHQKFVFFQMEPPKYVTSNTFNSNRTRYNFFNRTMTYRMDSDVIQRDLYGHTVKKRRSTNDHSFNIKNKSKLVAWIVSNCDTPIKREDYVTQLSRFVPVDVYGQCGNLSCGHKGSLNCYDMLKNDYKFYLAFENSFCTDYVTEKLFKPLYYDTVPIVMGSVDYNSFAPPNSFIDVRDFRSPKQLADYLIELDKSDDLYGRYFDWKREYEVDLSPMDGWCDLCRLAHDPTVKTYKDIKKWWLDEKQCDNNFISSVMPTG